MSHVEQTSAELEQPMQLVGQGLQITGDPLHIYLVLLVGIHLALSPSNKPKFVLHCLQVLEVSQDRQLETQVLMHTLFQRSLNSPSPLHGTHCLLSIESK